MILIILTLSCFAFGSSYVLEQQQCYGKNFRLPFKYTPPLFNGRLYFTPSKGGQSRRLVMENSEMKDPRLKVSNSVILTGLTEKDDGTFSASINGGKIHDVIRLKISDCAKQVERYYYGYYSHNVEEVEFLEFTHISRLDPTWVIWNRSAPRTNTGGRGQVKDNVWKINSLTQADSGFYNFRKKDNSLESRINLTIIVDTKYLDGDDVKMSGGRLVLQFPWSNTKNIRFTPKGSKESMRLVEDGNLIEKDWDDMDLTRRLRMVREGMEIDRVVSTDSGRFEFTDQDDNLALVVMLEIDDEHVPASLYVAIIAIIILMVIVCCCIRKCCCKKSSAKRQSAPQPAAPPATYHHVTSQPAGPRYSVAPPPPPYINPSLNPLSTREPTTSIVPQVASPGGQGAAPAASVGSDFLSSDFVPMFELKGVTFPSAPPLSSDSTYCDVYTSDKLNFL
ncbi:hypothetical protein PAMP_023673 [Pampus punctatissimus]